MKSEKLFLFQFQRRRQVTTMTTTATTTTTDEQTKNITYWKSFSSFTLIDHRRCCMRHLNRLNDDWKR